MQFPGSSVDITQILQFLDIVIVNDALWWFLPVDCHLFRHQIQQKHNPDAVVECCSQRRHPAPSGRKWTCQFAFPRIVREHQELLNWKLSHHPDSLWVDPELETIKTVFSNFVGCEFIIPLWVCKSLELFMFYLWDVLTESPLAAFLSICFSSIISVIFYRESKGSINWSHVVHPFVMQHKSEVQSNSWISWTILKRTQWKRGLCVDSTGFSNCRTATCTGKLCGLHRAHSWLKLCQKVMHSCFCSTNWYL